MATEAQLAVSAPVLQEVASHYPNLSPTELQNEVSQAPQASTQLFTVSVLDPSPTRAAALANDIAATMIAQEQQATLAQNQQAQSQIQQDLANTEKQISAIAATIAALQANGDSAKQLPGDQAQYQALQQHYTQLQNALAQLELAQAESGSLLRVVIPAQPSTTPTSPKVKDDLSGGVAAGLLLGVILVLLIELLDTRVRTATMASDLLGWPVLASIRSVDGDNERVIDPQNLNREEYRILRTSIGLARVDKPIRSILVTSANPESGKSTIAANLALFIARTGKNTLLVDADLRRPTQNRNFDIPRAAFGLSNAVVAYGQNAETNLESFIYSVGIPELRIMPSGPLPPNPPELLDSRAMQRVYKAIMRYGAEVVIFDGPPLLGLSDATILASKVDGVVFVVDASKARKGPLLRAKEICAQAGATVIGCVVNRLRVNAAETGYYHRYSQVERRTDAVSEWKQQTAHPIAAARVSSPLVTEAPDADAPYDSSDDAHLSDVSMAEVVSNIPVNDAHLQIHGVAENAPERETR